MKVFKFGGASVKDSKSIKNITRILKLTGYNDTIIVISAMSARTPLHQENRAYQEGGKTILYSVHV